MVIRAALLLILGLTWLAPSRAQDDPDTAIQRQGNAIIANPEAVINDADTFTRPQAISPADRQAIMDIASRGGQIAIDAMMPNTAVAPPIKGRVYRVFVSRAMPEVELKELIAFSADREDVMLVFRGFLPGEKFGEFQRAIQPLLGTLEQGKAAPAIQVDPPKFTEAGVTVAPTLAAYDDGKLIASVSGITSVDWLAGEIKRGARGKLAQQGPVVQITEYDLMAEMQKRAAAFDWDKARKGALTNFWKRQDFNTLPTATVASVRSVDPTFTVTETIKGARGEIIALAGTRINPLDSMPFRQRLVVFNGSDRAQVAAMKAYKQPGRRVTFITTQVDDTRGFDHLAEIQAAIGAQVFVLTPEIATRFQVQRVPSVIEAKGNRFEVREIPTTP